MSRHKAHRLALATMGQMYAGRQLPALPNLFEPQLVDEELREDNRGCTQHYDRINGVYAHAESYFGDRLAGMENETARAQLLDALETMRDATTADPVTGEDEIWFHQDDVDLVRAIIAPIAERAREVMLAINDGLSISDVAFSLRAELRSTDNLLEWAFSTARSADEVNS